MIHELQGETTIKKKTFVIRKCFAKWGKLHNMIIRNIGLRLGGSNLVDGMRNLVSMFFVHFFNLKKKIFFYLSAMNILLLLYFIIYTFFTMNYFEKWYEKV